MAVLAAEHHDHNIFGFGRQVNDPVRRDVWRFAQQLIVRRRRTSKGRR